MRQQSKILLPGGGHIDDEFSMLLGEGGGRKETNVGATKVESLSKKEEPVSETKRNEQTDDDSVSWK